MFELAGICGVEPWRFTVGELAVMAESKSKHNWDRTAEIWVILANAYRNVKEVPEPYTRDMVHPLRDAKEYEQEKPEGGDLSMFKAVWGRK